MSSSFLTVGTHYYVCTPHAFLQMKGIIIVQPLSGLKENKTKNEILIYPNPVKDLLNIQCNSSESNLLEINLFNIEGSLVKVLMTRTQVEMPFLKSFDLSEEIKSGVYILQIIEGDKASYKKVIVL